MPFRLALSALTLAFPIGAFAMSETVWDFRGGQLPGKWNMTGQAQVEQTENGLQVITQNDVVLVRDANLPHHTDTVEIRYSIVRDTESILMWHLEGAPTEHLVHLPFVFTAANTEVQLNPSWYQEWDPRTTRIGLKLPQGTQITIEQIIFRGYNPFEKAWEAWKTFWVLDFMRPSSINFVWGPLLAWNPVMRAEMLEHLPPHAQSANRAFYLCIALGSAFLLFYVWRKGWPLRSAVLPITLLIGALWMFYDLRMGIETIHYLKTDYDNYLSKEPQERIFREREEFPGFVEEVAPLVMDRDRYVFLAEQQYPHLGLIRYATYPSLPTMPTEAVQGIDTWVAYRRDDITLGTENQLMLNGAPLTGPGEMLLDWGNGTFVFRATP